MPETIFTEYRNENQLRNYPFTDDSALSNYSLPTDFIIDINIIYVRYTDIPKTLYLYISLIDVETRTVTIRESDKDTLVGTCYFRDNEIEGPIYNPSGVQIGIVVFGDSLSSLTSSKYRGLFTKNDLKLVSSCYTVLKQAGVSGFIVNGTFISDNVYFKGLNGLQAVSYTRNSDSKNILLFSNIGFPQPISDCFDVPEPIEQICFDGSLRLPATGYYPGVPDVNDNTFLVVTKPSGDPEWELNILIGSIVRLQGSAIDYGVIVANSHDSFVARPILNGETDPDNLIHWTEPVSVEIYYISIVFSPKVILDEHGNEIPTNMVCVSHPATMETVCPPSIAIPELKTEQIEKDVRCFPQYPVPVYSSPSEAFCVDPIEIVDGQPVYTGSITLLNCDNTDLFGSALTITVDDTSVSGEPAGAITVNIRSK